MVKTIPSSILEIARLRPSNYAPSLPIVVKHIEVIPNAGASFGQEAQGGIVRVTLRQKEGLIGAIGLTAQADGEGFVDAILTPTLQYQFGKLSVYNNLKLGSGNYRTRYKRQDNYGTHHVDRTFHSDKESLALLENLGLQYQLLRRNPCKFMEGYI